MRAPLRASHTPPLAPPAGPRCVRHAPASGGRGASGQCAAAAAAPTAAAPLCLASLPLEQLETYLATLPDSRAPASRAKQIFRWLHREKVASLADAAAGRVDRDGFSAAFLATLDAAGATADPGMRLTDVRTAGDGTRKLIFAVEKGPAAGSTVDAVLIPDSGAVPSANAPSPRPRLTLCVSCQVGCAQGCAFCLTGAAGRAKNLDAAQIVAQLTAARRLVDADPGSPPLTSVVFMGQGDFLDNADAVLAATKIMTDPHGHALAPRRVTVSTVGADPAALEAFVQRAGPISLAVSLHAATEETRSAIVPASRRAGGGLARLISTLERLFPSKAALAEGRIPRPPTARSGRAVLLEYVLLAGVNDSPADAAALVDLVQNVSAKINLIPFNPHPLSPFSPPTPAAVAAFRDVVVAGGFVCTVRTAKGADAAMAACGQLGEPSAGPPRAARAFG